MVVKNDIFLVWNRVRIWRTGRHTSTENSQEYLPRDFNMDLTWDNVDCKTVRIFVYSYFEKGCRKKCTRQSRKVLWMVLSSLFKEIWKNGMRSHRRMFAIAKGKQQGSTATLSGTAYCSYPILPCGIVACTFFPTTSRNSCIQVRAKCGWPSLAVFTSFSRLVLIFVQSLLPIFCFLIFQTD